MNRRDLVLAMLASAGGRQFTPVQMQKAVFLVSENMPHVITHGPRFNFQPYDYGPFDSDVYSEADALRAEGAVVVAPSGQGAWNTYAVTDAGLARGNQVLNRLDQPTRDYLNQISTWVRSQSFSSLVKAIYDAYPRMRANSIFRG